MQSRLAPQIAQLPEKPPKIPKTSDQKSKDISSMNLSEDNREVDDNEPLFEEYLEDSEAV